jgi:hypothetical protein
MHPKIGQFQAMLQRAQIEHIFSEVPVSVVDWDWFVRPAEVD